MRLTKIYTKIGDKGTTMLASGEMVPKDSMRIETYGTVDELNAAVGMLRDTLEHSSECRGKFDDLLVQLLLIQNELFDCGGELSTPQHVLNIQKQQVITHESVTRLEQEMDAYNAHLAPLANFVLPGGHPANSLAHLARTICRRAERHIVALARVDAIREEPRIYLNRLSDWFFVVSRVVSQRLGVAEVIWQQKGKTK